jgi:hypothetical protein
MKLWIILAMIVMSLGVATVIARLSGKKWGKTDRVAVFLIVVGITWLFFWLGMQ